MNHLRSKELRLIDIQKQMNKENGYIVIGVNFPGGQKNNAYTRLVLHHFANQIQTDFACKEKKELTSPAGDWIVFSTSKDPNIKKRLIEVEEGHLLGRLVDLDYYLDQEKSVSRASLGYELRSCFLCSKVAYVCQREQTHSKRSLIAYFKKQVKMYFTPLFKEQIAHAIFKELDLDDKFGLVTPTSRGSHPDMDYFLMKQAALGLLDDFTRFIWLGIQYSSNQAYLLGKKLGQEMEAKMLAITNGINAYKGLIFLLGFILLGFGQMLRKGKNWDAFPTIIKHLGKDIFKDLNYFTFGEQLITNKQIYGARGEIQSGLQTVLEIADYLKQATVSDETLHLALIKIIGRTHDSVLIKRSGSWENYLMFREKIGAITTYQKETIAQVTKDCIAQNISCGGAADILIGAILIRDLRKYT